MKVCFKRFTAQFQSWEEMLAEVGEFATAIGREHLINISCSEFGQYASTATVVVWYWGREGEPS
jgi:hypothetical protein